MIGTLWTSVQYTNEIKTLFSNAKSEHKVFRYSQLERLPEPVQQYFKLVLPEGQPNIRYVRLKHDGRFKTDLKKDWVAIKGEQYFTAGTPGFIWIGKTNLFTARDMFLMGKGGLQVKLFSLLKVADGKGAKFDQGELLRWLGESTWFPTNLLPSENLAWSAIDNTSAKLTYTFNQLTVSYIVNFNDLGEITTMETERYMGEENLEKWLGEFSDYQQINGIKIPTKAKGSWVLNSKAYPYADFKIQKIEYDIPERF